MGDLKAWRDARATCDEAQLVERALPLADLGEGEERILRLRETSAWVKNVIVEDVLAERAFELERIAQLQVVHELCELATFWEAGQKREIDLDDEVDIARSMAERRVGTNDGLAVNHRFNEDVLANGQTEVRGWRCEAKAEATSVGIDLLALDERHLDPHLGIESDRALCWGHGAQRTASSSIFHALLEWSASKSSVQSVPAVMRIEEEPPGWSSRKGVPFSRRSGSGGSQHGLCGSSLLFEPATKVARSSERWMLELERGFAIGVEDAVYIHAEVRVVHHAHDVPDEVVRLSVHSCIPSAAAELGFGGVACRSHDEKFVHVDLMLPEDPAPVAAVFGGLLVALDGREGPSLATVERKFHADDFTATTCVSIAANLVLLTSTGEGNHLMVARVRDGRIDVELIDYVVGLVPPALGGSAFRIHELWEDAVVHEVEVVV
eukprot:scaffold285613_cov32-Tisochrysis_lutea.AAC.3